jgi:tetratricopeptide (TPR) repeat protein
MAARALSLALLAALVACRENRGTVAAPAVAGGGSATCGVCHPAEHQAWSGSPHAWAMVAATAAAAEMASGAPLPLSDGSVVRPVALDGRPGVEVTSPRNDAARHVLRWAFGRRTLEQHLVEFPGGRLQALPIGFDLARREWFDVFAGDRREPTEWGHWTRPGMTANSQCLACHTTGYEKGYDVEHDAYQSRWQEAGVGCEACHGPGEGHVSARRAGRPDGYRPPTGERMLDTCATCHAVRREIAAGFRPGERFLDFFEPVLVDGDEFQPDGQVRQESYEWASFSQSRMHAAGVVCTDCHDVHATGLRFAGDGLCLRCHEGRLASFAHTRHPPDVAGARCVACHMPVTVFMQRDQRRDHSFPLPDPQATLDLGIPSACSRCHGDRGAGWAAEQVAAWHGTGARRTARRREAAAFLAAARGDPAAIEPLVACVDGAGPDVRRASAVRLLGRFAARPAVAEALGRALASAAPLVRMSAAWALSEHGGAGLDVRDRLLRAVRDDVRAVRVNAAWGLRSVRPGDVLPSDRGALATALDEWRDAALLLAEHPETHHSLGVFHADRGEREAAERSYRTALRLAPDAIPPRYNLAMLLVAGGALDAAEETLLEVRERDPAFAPAAYALGAVYGETGRWEAAAIALQDCLRIDPTYAGALSSLAHAYLRLGRVEVAMRVLRAAAEWPGARREALRALVAVSLELGDRDGARRWAETAAGSDAELAADPRVREILGR